MTDEREVHVFRFKGGVAMMLCGASIVEYRGDLTPGALLTPEKARRLAEALLSTATIKKRVARPKRARAR